MDISQVPWLDYVSGFLIIIWGTILNGLITMKSRDEKFVLKWQNNRGTLLLFIFVEAIVVYLGSTIFQPYLVVWLTQNLLIIPSLLIETIIVFYFWFNRSFGYKTNKQLLVISQILAFGIGVLFYTNMGYMLLFVICVSTGYIIYSSISPWLKNEKD